MNIINFISSLAMPLIILLIVLYGLLEKKEVFDYFLDGAKDGIKIMINMLSGNFNSWMLLEFFWQLEVNNNMEFIMRTMIVSFKFNFNL